MRIVLCLIVLGLCACAGPRKFVVVPSAAVHAGIDKAQTHIKAAGGDAKELKASIAKARELAKGNDALVLQLDQANEQVDRLTKSLILAGGSLNEAQTKLNEADKKNQKLVADANRAIEQKDKAVRRYRILKFPLCALIAGVVVFIMLKFRVALLALGWIGIGILVASPIVAFTAAWFAIDKLIDSFT